MVSVRNVTTIDTVAARATADPRRRHAPTPTLWARVGTSKAAEVAGAGALVAHCRSSGSDRGELIDHLVQRDRVISHPDAGGVVGCVGDSGSNPAEPEFADALGFQRR